MSGPKSKPVPVMMVCDGCGMRAQGFRAHLGRPHKHCPAKVRANPRLALEAQRALNKQGHWRSES